MQGSGLNPNTTKLDSIIKIIVIHKNEANYTLIRIYCTELYSYGYVFLPTIKNLKINMTDVIF